MARSDQTSVKQCSFAVFQPHCLIAETVALAYTCFLDFHGPINFIKEIREVGGGPLETEKEKCRCR